MTSKKMINKRKVIDYIQGILTIPIEWLLILPMSYIIPSRANTVCFIGKMGGIFSDNIKYLYLYVDQEKKKEIDFFFLTQIKSEYNDLKKSNIKVEYFFSIRGIRRLLESKIVIVDHMDWIDNSKFHLLYSKKKIQLWHGVGLKSIEKNINNSEQYKRKKNILKFFLTAYRFLKGRFPVYDYLICTSPFFSRNLFSHSFNYKKMIISGYPRNDILRKSNTFFDKNLILINSDSECIDMVKKYKDEQKKIILYAPTYRDSGRKIIEKDILDLERLSLFSKANNLIFILKFHPMQNEIINKQYDNIHIYNPMKDIYPLLIDVDILITDYSSLFYDFILTNKPTIFFPFDKKEYLANERMLCFDYDYFTPGIKCMNQEQIQDSILQKINDPENISLKFINKIHTFHDCYSSKNIYRIIEKELFFHNSLVKKEVIR